MPSGYGGNGGFEAANGLMAAEALAFGGHQTRFSEVSC